MRVRFLYNKTN